MQTAVFASSALGQGTHLSKRIKRCFLSLRWSGFSAARAATTALFQVQFRSVPELSDAALDMTTNRELLSQLHSCWQATLSRFCSRGGTAVLNCFSAWTVNGGAPDTIARSKDRVRNRRISVNWFFSDQGMLRMGEGVGEVSWHFPRALGEIWRGLCHQAIDR